MSMASQRLAVRVPMRPKPTTSAVFWKRSKGRATLLGDACHPMLPFMAQGAAMAIEDAAVLANTLSTQPTIADALCRYESLRIPRTRRVQSGSRRNAQLFHASGIRAFLRNRVMARGSAAVTRRLFNYDAVNTQ